ncbi:hypothetical protein GWC77_27015 [Paraburkholderia sp. NMBU_R16]|uniref:polyprenyl synthetase family protein n=1 Tax=Paraburkholderia sp. NMBU_R16 TaxID=2698676 RepID=UPI001566D1B6|nr:polyprenyl synthetase family protein [Paraburkholderia sp. NMBU_R16]NRO99525.1 hypothetical protein [Paraburkholderia sp. NMBU_R16]
MDKPSSSSEESALDRLESSLRKGVYHEGRVQIGLEQMQAYESMKQASLPVAFYSALGGKKPAEIVPIGTSIALLHEAFLIVDDIQDNDTRR